MKNTMKTRMLSIVMLMCMLVSMFPTSAFADPSSTTDSPAAYETVTAEPAAAENTATETPADPAEPAAAASAETPADAAAESAEASDTADSSAVTDSSAETDPSAETPEELPAEETAAEEQTPAAEEDPAAAALRERLVNGEEVYAVVNDGAELYADAGLNDSEGIWLAAEAVVRVLAVSEDGKAVLVACDDAQGWAAFDSVTVQESYAAEVTIEDPMAVLAEDGEEAVLMDGGEGNLTEVASVTVKTTATGDQSRSGSLSLNVEYTISNDNVQKAASYDALVYDLSEFVETYPSIKGIENNSGDMYTGTTKTGTYRIEDNKVYLYIDHDYISKMASGVSGTFNFTMDFELVGVGTQDSINYNFPGTSTPVEVKFEDVKVDNSKTINYSSSNDGTTEVQVDLQDDGSAIVTYRLEVKPNADLSTLTLSDTLGAGQTLVDGTLKYSVDWEGNYETLTNNGSNTEISADLLQAVKNSSRFSKYSETANHTYKVEYQVKVDASQVGNATSNTATWSWDGGNSGSSSTNVKIIKTKTEIPVTKSVTPDGSDKTATTRTYTIKVGEAGMDMSNFVLTDSISGYEVYDGSVTMKDKNGNTVTITPSSTTQFTYTFPSGSNNGPYTVTYNTTVTDSGNGTTTTTNTAKVHDPSDNYKDGSAGTTTGYTYPEQKVTKTLQSFDPEKNEITWTVQVDIDESHAPYSNVVVTDTDAKYGNGQYSINQALTIKSMSADGGTYDVNAKTLTFATLSNDVTVTVVAEIPNGSADSYTSNLWVYNKAKINIGGTEASSETTNKYSSNSWSMDKTGAYDKSSNVFNWTVVVNADKNELNPNITKLPFSDTIPEGMEYVSKSLKVVFGGNDGQTQYWDNNILSESNFSSFNSSSNTISIDDLFNYSGNWQTNPVGLSGIKVTISYQTKFADGELAKVYAAENHTKEYTNKATVGGKEDTSTVTYTYNRYLSKTDTSDTNLGQNSDVIHYQITVNPDALTLNSGIDMTLTDTISTAVELVTDSVTVKDADGNTVDGHAGYEDDSRVLTLTLPDAKALTVDLDVRVRYLTNGQTFTNSVTLSGSSDQSAEVSKWHVVVSHGATITGDVSEIHLSKIDQNDIKTKLPGAYFDLYKITWSEKAGGGYDLSAAELVAKDLVSDANGSVTLSGLSVFGKTKEGVTSVGDLYYWVETQAPDGYEAATSEPHYFVVYDETGARI